MCGSVYSYQLLNGAEFAALAVIEFHFCVATAEHEVRFILGLNIGNILEILIYLQYGNT